MTHTSWYVDVLFIEFQNYTAIVIILQLLHASAYNNSGMSYLIQPQAMLQFTQDYCDSRCYNLSVFIELTPAQKPRAAKHTKSVRQLWIIWNKLKIILQSLDIGTDKS